jgi:hypothetical protein
VLFLCKKPISSIGDVLSLFDHFTRRSVLPIQDDKPNGIGGNNTSAPIGKADQICRMYSILEQLRLCGFFGRFTSRRLFKKYIICANILALL